MYYRYLLKILPPFRISIRLLATSWDNYIVELIKRVVYLWRHSRITYNCIYIAASKCFVPYLTNAFSNSYTC